MEPLLVTSLALHLMAVEVLAGLQLFAVTQLAPAFRGQPGMSAAMSARIGAASALCLMAAAATMAAWLWLVAGKMAGRSGPPPPAVVLAVLRGTQFGRLFLLRMGLAAIAAASLAGRRRTGGGLVWSQLLLVSLSFVSHEAAGAGMRPYGLLLIHAFHLAATSAWVGSLPAVAVLAGWAAREAGGPVAEVAGRVLRSYGRYAGGVVAGIIVTGVAMLAVMTPDGLSLSQPFVRILAVKLGLVAATGGLGLINRLALVPRLRLAPAATFRALYIFITVEAVVALAVVAAAAALSQAPPA